MNNWETEYEVKYHITSKQDDGKQEVKSKLLIVEASTKTEAINKIKYRFNYNDDVKIDEVKTLWKY
jgi:hypothetical protein